MGPARKASAGVAEYAELCVTSNFTFLTGASHPEELVTRAADLGLSAIAITDRNSLAGVVRAHVALRELARMRAEAAQAQIKVRSQIQMDSCSRQDIALAPALAVEPTLKPLPRLIIGVRLVLMDSGVQWLALPTDRAAYARLSRLLSLGKGRAPKGECHLRQADVMDHATGLILIALPPGGVQGGAGSAADTADLLKVTRRFAGMVYLGAAPHYDGQDQPRFDALAALSQRTGLPMVALGDVLMHHGSRRRLADVLTCLREGLTVDRIGKHALPNAELRIKTPVEMARLAMEDRDDYQSEAAVLTAIAGKLGCSPDSLRVWMRQVRAGGDQPGQTTAEKARSEPLRRHWFEPNGEEFGRKVRELKQANEILRKALAYFAQAELDRPLRKCWFH